MPKFHVLHPVLKDKTLHRAGTEVTLSPEHGDALTKSGHVRPAAPAPSSAVEAAKDQIEPGAVEAAGLDAYTKAELIAYAKAQLNVILNPSATRQEMIREILAADTAKKAGAA